MVYLLRLGLVVLSVQNLSESHGSVPEFKVRERRVDPFDGQQASQRKPL